MNPLTIFGWTLVGITAALVLVASADVARVAWLGRITRRELAAARRDLTDAHASLGAAVIAGPEALTAAIDRVEAATNRVHAAIVARREYFAARDRLRP